MAVGGICRLMGIRLNGLYIVGHRWELVSIGVN